MFKTQNFCHIASNNRNQVKVGVFVYRTTDSLATVLASGYFNDRIIDINLHDLIIHEQIDNADATKVQRNLLCVTERSLENVGTSVIKSKWEGDIEQDIADIEQEIAGLGNSFVKIDGSSVMTGPLKFSAGSMRGAVAPYLNGVSFWKMDSQGTITNIANLTDSQFFPVTTNSIDLGNTTHTWKDAYVARVITSVLNNGYDIAVPVTNSADTLALKSEVDLAANSGRMITAQGVWYAKMYAGTTAPAAEDGTNYADFSQTDGQGNPIIVIYERTSGAWVQSETITPPAEYDGYVPITSKIWDIAEQTGQQGGRVLWNHQSKEFTPYPQIVSFDNIEVTGVSTVVMPANPVQQQIVNKEYVDTAVEGAHYHPELLSYEWDDHERSDMNWVNALTFSWQDGGVYEVAYQHLVDDFNEITPQLWTIDLGSHYGIFVRDSAHDHPGYTSPYTYKNINPNASQVYAYARVENPTTSDSLYSAYGSSAMDMGAPITAGYAPQPQTETIAGITIEYYLAPDGHKIVLADQESNVADIYTATGVAWYYILDTANERFKLPRSKHNKYATTNTVIGNGSPLVFTDGTDTLYTMRNYKGVGDYYNTFQFTTETGVIGETKNISQAHTQKIVGVSSSSTNSGLSALQEQDTDQYKYLYFYVGSFTQTALENTAGLNASLFNNKADLDLANVLANIDYVVESQLPTADNNYTWYRKYRSGWVEQGQKKIQIAHNSNGLITLPVAMANTDYIAQAGSNQVNSSGTFGANSTISANAGTTTQVRLGQFNSASTHIDVWWEVKGMAA